MNNIHICFNICTIFKASAAIVSTHSPTCTAYTFFRHHMWANSLGGMGKTVMRLIAPIADVFVLLTSCRYIHSISNIIYARRECCASVRSASRWSHIDTKLGRWVDLSIARSVARWSPIAFHRDAPLKRSYPIMYSSVLVEQHILHKFVHSTYVYTPATFSTLPC